MVRPHTRHFRSRHWRPHGRRLVHGTADTAECAADRGDAEPPDSLLAEREEAGVTTGVKHAATAAAAHNDPAAPGTSGRDIFPAVQRLKQEQARLRADKNRVAKELKNAEKRRSRLKRKAKQLSDGDLLAVLETRALEKERARAEVAAAAPAAGNSTPAPHTPPCS